MALEDMRQDIRFLSGHLAHRGALTHREREAAEYIEQQFKSSTPLTQVEPFYSPELIPAVVVLYHVEFLVVVLLAMWSPGLAVGYAIVVFIAYMAEISGYSAFSRFLPQFETQNVVARISAESPKRTVVFTANYDGQRASVLGSLSASAQLRWMQSAIILSMILVIAACGYRAAGPSETGGTVSTTISWFAVGFLLFTAWKLYVSLRTSEYTASANNNASGVAVLIELARRFSVDPSRDTELMFVATGGKEVGLRGARHLLRGMEWFREQTVFINICGVGGGKLAYTTGEGLLSVFSTDSELQDCASREGIDSLVYRGFPTDAFVPLTRGYRAISIMGTGPGGAPLYGYTLEDTVVALDDEMIQRATDIVERMTRGLGDQAQPVI